MTGRLLRCLFLFGLEISVPKLTAIRKQALDEMMKEALFKATIGVLGAQGVNGLTMDRVAAEAGVAKGSVYRYFHSKRDLLEFAYDKVTAPIFRVIEELANQEEPAIVKLAGHLHSLLEHIAKHAHVHKLLFEDDAVLGLLLPSERQATEVASQQLAGVFRQGIAEGVFSSGDPLLLAKMYLGLCKSVLQCRPKLEKRDQRESVHRLIMDTFLNGVAKEKVCVDGQMQ